MIDRIRLYGVKKSTSQQRQKINNMLLYVPYFLRFSNEELQHGIEKSGQPN